MLQADHYCNKNKTIFRKHDQTKCTYVRHHMKVKNVGTIWVA